MRWKKKVLIPLLVAVMLAQGFPVGTAEEGNAEAEIPSSEEISEVVQTECGIWLQKDLDLLGEHADRARKAYYGHCAIHAVLQSGILDRIGRYCEGSDRDCVGTLIETGIGPQYAALIEACAFVNEVGIHECSYESLVVPFGQWYTSVTPPPPDIVEWLCENGVCLDKLIGVKHQRIKWPDGYSCPGNQVETQVTSGGGGWLVNLGILVVWGVGSRSTVTTDVTWEVDCAIPITIHGFAWGGFFRQLRIERNLETEIVCDYDGLVLWNCGDLPGQHWEESTAAGREGAYDYDEDDGEQPPRQMDVFARSGGNWYNEGAGSTQAVQLLDKVDATVSGSTTYLVDYPDPDESIDSLPGLVESLLPDSPESRF